MLIPDDSATGVIHLRLKVNQIVFFDVEALDVSAILGMQNPAPGLASDLAMVPFVPVRVARGSTLMQTVVTLSREELLALLALPEVEEQKLS